MFNHFTGTFKKSSPVLDTDKISKCRYFYDQIKQRKTFLREKGSYLDVMQCNLFSSSNTILTSDISLSHKNKLFVVYKHFV